MKSIFPVSTSKLNTCIPFPFIRRVSSEDSFNPSAPLTVSALTSEPVGHSSAGQNLFRCTRETSEFTCFPEERSALGSFRSSHFYEKEIIFIRTVPLHSAVHCLYRKNFVIEQSAGQFFRNKRFVGAEREQFFPHLRRLFFKRRFLGKFVFKGKRIFFFVGFLRKQRAIVFFIGDLFRRR